MQDYPNQLTYEVEIADINIFPTKIEFCLEILARKPTSVNSSLLENSPKSF